MTWKRGDVVDVAVTIGSAVVTQQGFGTPLILSETIRSANTVDTFTSAAAMVSAGYLTTDREYLMASAIFNQTSKDGKSVPTVKIGKKLSDNDAIEKVVFDANATAGTFTLDISLAGAASVTSGAIDYDDAAADVETVLAAMANITSADVTLLGTQAGDKLGFTIEFDGNPNTAFEITAVNVGSLTSVTTGTASTVAVGSAVETWSVAYAAVKAEDDDFYLCLPGTETAADILELAALTGTEKKQFWYVTRDDAVRDKTAGNVQAELEILAFKNQIAFYHTVANQYVNCALAGATLPDNLYGINVCYYTLAGITADTLTDTYITNLTSYNINIPVYDGDNVVIPGAFAGSTGGNDGGIATTGDFIDYVAADHFLDARITEGVYGLLKSVKKISFDDRGLFVVKTKIESLADIYGVQTNIITPGTVAVTMPDLSSYDPAKKAARWLDDVAADGSAAGAISKISINFKLAV